jgi:predicted enzyme related to lactoylglutathione lyase
MVVKSSELSWLVVANLKQAVEFYTKTLGLKLLNMTEEHGWAELQGKEGGTMIGLCQTSDCSPLKPGNNAVMTFTVSDMDQARKELQARGLTLVGPVVEVPGHVKMQDFVDPDNNRFQLVQQLGTCC